MITTLKIFGTGQVTLPKAWREKFKTDHFVAQETSEGLLIKPLVEDGFFYELEDGEFGISFPLGMAAKEVHANLKKANGEV
ncbi:MAG: AbrB/MazE/SpoVT family DNA-binding domain-containing protein [Candidatus Gracilibacteria bacterium]